MTEAPVGPDTASDDPRREDVAQRGRLPRLFATRLLPSSLLNFLSGLLAGAGINLLTGIVGGSSGTTYIRHIEWDSAAWVLASSFAALAAHYAEKADDKANLTITPEMSRQLKETIIRDETEQVARRFWAVVAAMVVTTVLAIVFVPGLSL